MSDPTPSEFVAELRAAQAAAARGPRAALPPPDVEAIVRQVQPREDLAARFVAEATAAGCAVRRTDRAGLAAAVRECLDLHGARTVWIERPTQGESDCAGLDGLADALRGDGRAVARESNRETLFELDAAITLVDSAVAETGSVVCASGPSRPRGASLLPRVHVAVVPADRIVADLCDVFARMPREGTALPSGVVIITGPSKTADIEGVLVTGVHGPTHVEIIVVE